MGIQTQIILSLALFDAAIVTALYFWLRSYPRQEGSFQSDVAGLSGFLVFFFMFCQGPMLFLQLTTFAAIVGLCWLHRTGRLSKSLARIED